MKFNGLYESSIAEPDFKWYENPSKEQMNEVAGRDNKIHFVAFPDKKIIVFPYQISFKEFMEARGGKLHFHKEDAMFGTAQKSGLGWMLLTIVNKRHMPDLDLSKWEWLNKYININMFKKHSEEFSDRDVKDIRSFASFDKSARDEYRSKKENLKKTSLKDFLGNYGKQSGKN